MHLIKLTKKQIIIGSIVITITGVGFYLWYNNMLPGQQPTKISSSMFAYIQSKEGYEPTTYLDTGGVLTGGYGHTGPEVNALGVGAPVPTDLAVRWLNEDISDATTTVLNLVNVALDQYQLDALVDFQFNTGKLAVSTLLTDVNNGDFTDAAQFDETHYITDSAGNQLPGLVTRREYEAGLLTS